jgi:hypothetical protein
MPAVTAGNGAGEHDSTGATHRCDAKSTAMEYVAGICFFFRHQREDRIAYY